MHVRIPHRLVAPLVVACLTVGAAPFAQVGTAAATVDEPPPPPSTQPSTPTPVTFNEFLPEDRGLGECISSLPRPGCGSEARGGWRQTLVFLSIVAGLGVIVWRIVAGARRARRPEPSIE